MRQSIRLSALAFVLLGVAACHTTQMGRSVGFPTPQERGIR